MSAEFTPQFQQELLDDFHVEADEHLAAIRASLVALEQSDGKSRTAPELIQQLFRSLHSFKGNAAIVGLRPAEQLAHATEDYLRELSRGSAQFDSESLDVLMAAVQRLEQIVAAHREKEPIPEATHLIDQLRGPAQPQTATPKMSAGKIVPADRIKIARAAGTTLWEFKFTPSRELDQRGVNVNAVRARITDLGEILQATPVVLPTGSISFDFIAAMRQTPTDLASWESDGIAAQPYTPPPDIASEPAPDNPGPRKGTFIAPSHIVRVDLSRLDDLMRITGEMVIHRARLEDQIGKIVGRKDSTIDTAGLQELHIAFGRALRELREAIMRVRLVPVAEIFSRMPFVVRDLARETGRRIRVTVSGQDTEIDKYLVERLKDPLLHLVRNSVTHGIESSEERIAAGKPAAGTIYLHASNIGDTVLIEIGDDGRGIDVEEVSRRAIEQRLPVPQILTPTALLNLICLPGFSTRDKADRGAGRGVGMAVVNDTIRELGGTLSLETDSRRGTKFSLRLPLTLAIADVLVLAADDQTCAVPQSFVHEILEMNRSDVRRVNGTEVMPYRDGVLPLVRLRAMFGAKPSVREVQPVLVLTSERGATGLVVDRIQGQREVVVRAIRDPLIQSPGIAAATELGDGRPVLILDAAALTAGVVRPNRSGENMTAPGLAISI